MKKQGAKKGGRRQVVTVTYLALDRRNVHVPPAPLAQTAILRAEAMPVHFYRYLYDAVGRDYYWIERRLWDDGQLGAMLADRKLAVYVLYIGGVPAGFAELDFREPNLAQIVYFGLIPEFTGRRIAPWFLHQAIELAWTESPARIQVATCSLDHPRALSLYQRAGFNVYARGERVIDIPLDYPEPNRKP